MRRRPSLNSVSLLLPVLLGGTIGIAGLHRFSKGERTRFDELALGELTTSVFPVADGDPIHGENIDSVAPVLSGLRKRGSDESIIWLGNSQLHAINEAGPKAEPASALLYRRLAPRGVQLLTFSQPNANLQEHYVLYEYLRTRVKIRCLLLPVVFDDFREAGIRAGLAPALSDPAVRAKLSATAVGRQILELNANAVSGDAKGSNSDLGGVQDTTQELSERLLNDWLNRHAPLWEARPELRGRLLQSLYQWRNRALGISAQTKRHVIRGRYDLNMAAFAAILDDAQRDHISVLTYVVPLRTDVETPYDEAEYQAMKSEVERLSADKGARFADFQDVVPGEYWGLMADQKGAGKGYDFMHFQEPGHALLASAIERELESMSIVGRRDTFQ